MPQRPAPRRLAHGTWRRARGDTTVALNPTLVSARLAGLKPINYYPSANAWQLMWTSYSGTQTNTDMAKIASLGFNAVHIRAHMTPTGTFDYPSPTNAEITNLQDVVSKAWANGLSSIFTVFDFPPGTLSTDADSNWVSWANAVLGPFAGDSRLAYVDLFNEVDPTDSARMAWLSRALPYCRQLLAGVPVTASVNTVTKLRLLQTQIAATPPDLWDLHIYSGGAYGTTYGALRSALTLCGAAPLTVGECGIQTYTGSTVISGLPSVSGSTEAWQDAYHRAVRNAGNTVAASPIAMAPWMLYDVVNPGGIPTYDATLYNNQPQYFFGLVRTDNSSKPAATSFTSMNGGSVDLSINNSFASADASNNPLLWRTLGTGTFAWDNTTGHSDSFAVKITNGSASGSPAWYAVPLSEIRAGVSHTFSAWAKGNGTNGGTTRLQIDWYYAAPDDGTLLYLTSSLSSALATNSSTWTQLTATGSGPTAQAKTWTTTLSAGANPGDTQLSVSSIAGFQIGGTLTIGSETPTVTDIQPGKVLLSAALTGTYTNGTSVSFAGTYATNYAELHCVSINTGASGSVWFDDVTFS